MAETDPVTTYLEVHLIRHDDGTWELGSAADQAPSFAERGNLVHDIFPILMSLDLGKSWAGAWIDLMERTPKSEQQQMALLTLQRMVAMEKAAHG